MPDPISWYTLPRTATDLQSIKEAVDAKLLSHNQDPSAHGQTGEGVYTHRIASILDHVDESVKNAKILKMARTYKYIVDPAGDGDYTTIAVALTQVIADAGGSIFVKDGVYSPIADLVVPSNCFIRGESMDGVIIDFNSGNFQMIAEGAGNEAPSGTISVVHDDATVTGAGSDFVNEINAGDFVLINDTWYEAASITDGTHLELEEIYRGNGQAGLDYRIMIPKTNLGIENLTIRESADAEGLKLVWLKDCFFDKIRCKNNTNDGLTTEWLSNSAMKDIFSHGNGGKGIVIRHSQSSYFEGLSAYSNDSYGIFITSVWTRGNLVIASNASHNAYSGFFIYSVLHNSLVGCEAIGNKQNGFGLSSASRCKLLGCSGWDNGEDGFNLHLGSDRNRIVGGEFRDNGGWGGDVENTCDRNVFLGLDLTGNVSGAKRDLGANNDWGHNQEA